MFKKKKELSYYEKQVEIIRGADLTPEEREALGTLISSANAYNSINDRLRKLREENPPYAKLQELESYSLSKGHCDSAVSHTMVPLEIIIREWADNG